MSHVKPSNAVLVQGRSGQLALVTNDGKLAVDATVSAEAEISGQTTRLWQGSGHNGVYITSQSGNIFSILDDSGRLAMTNSGVVTIGKISGETINALMSGSIVALWGASGRNPIYITNQSGNLSMIIDDSGRAAVTNSGAIHATWPASGRNPVYLTNQAGNLSTEVVGTGDIVSGNFSALYGGGFIYGYSESGAVWNRIRSTESGTAGALSGTGFRLLVSNSGDPVATYSGFNSVQLFSGTNTILIGGGTNTAIATTSQLGPNDAIAITDANSLYVTNANFAWDLSGSRWRRMKQTESGSPLSQDGIVNRVYVDTTQAGATVRNRISGYLPVHDLSGGASLGSGRVIHGVKLRNISGTVNGTIWIGGSGTNLSPFSGHGYPLFTMDTFELARIQNFNQIRVVASISGILLAATGIDF